MQNKFRVLDKIYEGSSIHFQIGNDFDVMVNATEMIKLYPAKLMKDFLRLESTNYFIHALLDDLNNGNNVYNHIHYPEKNQEKDLILNFNEENPPHYIEKTTQNEAKNDDNEENPPHYILKKYTKEDVIITNKKGGTLMRRELALEFAMWLDVKLKIWLIRMVDNILYIEYNVQFNNIVKEIEETKAKIKEYRFKIYKKIASNDDAIACFDLMEKLNRLNMLKRTLNNKHHDDVKKQYEIPFDEMALI
jgi:hypothetical protein